MDEQLIFALIDRFDASSMTALDFNDGGITLSLRKSRPAPEAGPVEVRNTAMPAVLRSGNAVHTEHAPSGHNAGDSAASEYITSPIVGVFYTSSGPDSPPFVKAGSTVKAGQVICVIEAMKMLNKLEAEFDCEIVAIKASNGEMVEYGETLFEVKRL